MLLTEELWPHHFQLRTDTGLLSPTIEGRTPERNQRSQEACLWSKGVGIKAALLRFKTP